MLVEGEDEDDHWEDEHEEGVHRVTHSFEQFLKFISFVVIVQSYQVDRNRNDEIEVEFIEQFWARINQLIHLVSSEHVDPNDSSILILVEANSTLVHKVLDELVPKNDYLQDEVRSNVQH